jgi:hypothetical protein
MSKCPSERVIKTDEVEITPAMIEAGCAVLDGFSMQDMHEGWLSREDVVTSIYRAMKSLHVDEQQLRSSPARHEESPKIALRENAGT